MKRIAVIASLFASQFFFGTASANDELGVRVSNQFVDGTALRAFGGSRDLVQAEIDLSHAVLRFGRAELWADLSWTVGQRSGSLLGSFDTTLLAQQLTAGMRLTIPVAKSLPWIVPQLRVELGALLGEMSLLAPAGSASDWQAGFTGEALAGVELLLPREWMNRGDAHGFTAGLVIEGGYTYATRLAFSLTPDASSNTLQMPVTGTNAGTVSLSGGLLRIGALLRF